MSSVPDKFLKPYNPKETEGSIYKKWEDSGYFNPDKLPERHKEPFYIPLPPPNVTGVLHTGHAMMLAVEDIVARFNRMRGKKVLWLPGTDHAAIATQSVVEKQIAKEENKSRYDISREELIKRIEKFALDSHDTIVGQLRRMGSSLNWSREAYTLDEKRNLAVRTAFKKMFDDGLIYRGHRIVNWDPKGQTTISDDEIVYEERAGKLFTLKYSTDFPISIATTRPETKVGDTAVAVHPDDERYKKYVGKEYEVAFCDVPIHIKIVADKEVDPEFGTGAVGVTPAHSHIDADIASRHDLNGPQVIDEKARMKVGGRLNGKKVSEARAIVVEWLKENNLLEKEEDIKQNIATAERTGGVVEPLPKLQWFVDVNKEFTIPNSKIPGIDSGAKTSLKHAVKMAMQSGAVKIIPERFEKIYYHWIDNLRDWCISRQIWFGHRIPVWYKGEEAFCDTNPPQGEGWRQDEDTLDTWFSSGLWTFSALGWPEETPDLKTYHPANLLETGYDILFFWVARMILMSAYCLGDVPFKTVYLHGLVRDEKGRKMSKSLGNIIDPVEKIEKYGADALRMALIIGTAPGNDSKLSEDKIRAYKLFANKLWNIARFIIENCSEHAYQLKGEDIWKDDISEFNKWGIWQIVKEATEDMEHYRFYLAGEKLYHFVWHSFADKIIEESKVILRGNDEEAKKRIKFLLAESFENLLKLLHPFMPFITEEIWGSLPKNNQLLMIEKWPNSGDN